MATYTSHLNLKLPDYSDTADIKDLNENFKKIDDAITSGGTGGGTGGGIVTETDPTVPSWAKQPSKPTYTAAEVGALPDTTVIPTVPSALPNPQPIVINGISYDGSEAKTVTIESTGGGASVELDTTLTQYGKAADAGAVGNAIAQETAAREAAVNSLNEAIGNKLDASALPTAVNDALAQAKASGEFDGADGAKGADGYTPVRGTDYWTAADQEQIVSDVLAALPNASGVTF